MIMSMVKLMVAMRTPRMKRKYQSSPTRNSCRFTHSKHPVRGKQGTDLPKGPAPGIPLFGWGSHLEPFSGRWGRVSSCAPTPAPSPPPPLPSPPAAPRGRGAPSRESFWGLYPLVFSTA